MLKKIIKHTSRIVLGIFLVFWGFITLVALFPDENYHHCEAGQEEMSPIYGVLITIVLLITFCIVWYKTNDKTTIEPNVSSFPEVLPEPYKSFEDIDKYISGLTWSKIENDEMVAPANGLYLFNCRGDNHTFIEAHEIEKGENLCKHYRDHHSDGWATVKPLEYYLVEEDNKEFVLKGLKML